MNVVLDLDGTLVFPEEAEIAIPGRSRPTFLATETAVRLERIARKANLVIATARNGTSVAGLVRGLPDVAFGGYVLESGLVWRHDIHEVIDRMPERDALAERLRDHLPDWEHVPHYDRMICVLAPHNISDPLDEIRQQMADWELSSSWISHQERHKTFLYPQPLCKRSGLRELGCEQIDIAAGDDSVYDRTFLEAAQFAVCPAESCTELQEIVRAQGGLVGTKRSHAAAVELLEVIEAWIDAIQGTTPSPRRHPDG